MKYTIGIDIGGTFTDCVVVASDGSALIAKASSTPPNFEQGVLDAVDVAADKLGLSSAALLAQSLVFHGCTVGTNALVEGRTAKVGLLVSAGHTETFFVMQSGYRMKNEPPEYLAAFSRQHQQKPLVPRRLVKEIGERVTFDGHVLAEAREQQVREAVGQLITEGAEAFAVSLLWSVVNDAHEQLVARVIRELAPDAFVSLASEVVPRVGEYERTVASVLNSLVGPVMKSYLDALTSRLKSAGYEGQLGIMSCWGGLIDEVTAARFPILTIGSGPAAGMVAAQILAKTRGEDVITADMGGTTFDVGLIADGQAASRTSSRYEHYEYSVPTLDVRSVGAGGGSIIRYDAASRTLKVGPQSAGARPGPAAFLRGGTAATVTDADLVLGYLNPESLLGGTMGIGHDAAVQALAEVGAPLGFSAEETAAAAARIVDNQMADAVRVISVHQGRDPRRFVMHAYGGNGPVHASAIAMNLGMSEIVVPLRNLASGWSAFGVAASDAVVIEELGLPIVEPFDPEILDAAWQRLERRALERLALQGVAAEQAIVRRLVEMKYSTQVHQVRVEAPAECKDADSIKEIIAAFEAEYQRIYGEGTGFPAAGYAIASLVVHASAQIASVDLRPTEELESGAPPILSQRAVIWYELGLDRVDTTVYDGDKFRPGMAVAGPAIVEFDVTTLVVRPGQTARVDAMGNVTVALKGDSQ